MDTAYASSAPPSNATGEQALSQNLTGGLRVQLMSGGSDVSPTNPITVGFQNVTDAAALTSGADSPVGDSVLLSATTTGTVTLTLESGATVVVHPQVGDNIYPFRITKATVGTAVITSMYNLYQG